MGNIQFGKRRALMPVGDDRLFHLFARIPGIGGVIRAIDSLEIHPVFIHDRVAGAPARSRGRVSFIRVEQHGRALPAGSKKQ